MTRKYRSKIQQRSFQNFMKEAKVLRERGILTDFTLECEGDVFPVHRMVLAASSPYFRDYFTQQKNFKQTTIKIDFMKSIVLQTILDYLYTGRITVLGKDSQIMIRNLLVASSQLKIPLLCEYCLELLLNKSCNDLSLSDWKNIEDLQSELINQIFLNNILKKLPSFPESEAFLQCTFNQINRLLFGPEATDCDQSIVLQCILTWIKHDLIGRKEYLTTFLEKVEFERIHPIQFSNFKDENLLAESKFFLRLCTTYLLKYIEAGKIDKKQTSHIKQQITDCQRKSNGKPKSSTESSVNADFNKSSVRDIARDEYKFLIYDPYSNYYKTQIYIYDYATDNLERKIDHPLDFIKTCPRLSYKNSIYLFPLNKDYMYTYDVKTNEWIRRCLKAWKGRYLLKSFLGVAAVELNGYIYDIGGYLCKQTGKGLLRIDPESYECKYVASLPVVNKNGNVTIVAVNDCLFAWLDIKLYKYIPEDDKWFLVETELNNKIETEDVHMVTGNGRIFIIEKSQPKNVWIYDPIENSLSKDFVPSEMKDCDGILNLENPQQLEFLVSGSEKWFMYRPLLHSWIPFDPKSLKYFKISTLTLLLS